MTRIHITLATTLILASFLFAFHVQASTGPAWWDFDIDTNSVAQIDDPWTTPSGSTNEVYGISGSETEVTVEIRDLAHALQNDPVRIYVYVRDHITYLPRFGVRKGALGTLISKTGGDLDQCSLLIALLLAADPNSDAHIVKAQVDYTMTFLGNLLDIPSGSVVNVLDNHGFDIESSGSNARLVHFWVEATIDGQVRVLDPAFVQSARVAGANIPSLLGYSRSTFLAHATEGATVGTDYVEDLNYTNITNDLRQFTTNLLQTIRNDYPTASVDDFLGYSRNTESPVTALPTNLSHVVQIIEASRVSYAAAPLPDSLLATVKIDHSACGINRTFKAHELAGKRVSITYTGGSRVATLKVDGLTVATGNSTTAGQQYNCTLTLTTPWAGAMPPSGVSPAVKLTSGESYVVLADFDTASPGLLQRIRKQISRARADGSPDTSEAVLCGSLDLIGQQWVMEHRLSAQLVGKLQGAKAAYALCGGFVKQEDGYAVDLPIQSYRGYFTAGIDDVYAAYRAAGLMGSAFEHAVLEQTQGSHKPAASTVKLLWKGNADGHRTYLADSSNWSTVRTLIQGYDSNAISSVSGWISAGLKVMLPGRGDHVIGDWQGMGYLAYKTGTSLSTVYAISGDLSGGAGGYLGNVDVQTLLAGLNLDVEGSGLDYNPTLAADPVDLFTGDLVLSRRVLGGAGTSPRALDLSIHYSSGQSDQKGTLGHGWRHSLDITASAISHPAPSAGLRQPSDLVPLIVRSIVVGDILKYELNLKGYLISALVSKWQADQMTDNAVTVRAGNRTLAYVRMPDGTFNPPPGVTTGLILTNGQYRLQERFGRELRFDSNGNLASLLDADGNTMTVSYNSLTNVQTVTDSSSRTLTFAYSGDKVSGVTESAGGLSRPVSFGYSGDDLVSLTDADGNVWSYVYDADHQLLATGDPLLQTTVSNIYNGSGQVVTQYNGYGETWAFHVSGPWGTEIDPLGNATAHYFDRDGRNLGKEDPLGNRTENSYDALGRLVTTIDANGNTNRFYYDTRHNPTNRVDALGQAWKSEYDSGNHLVASRDPLGNTTRYQYDSEHHLTAVSNAIDGVTIMTYTPDGLPYTVTDAESNLTVYAYDSYGNPQTITRTDGGTVTNTWSARGEITVARDAIGNPTTYTCNKRGVLTSVTDADGNTVSNIYNAAGLKTQTIDPRDESTIYTYTPTYEISTIAYPDGGTVSNTYDAANRLVAVTDAETNTTVIIRDAAGRTVATSNALGHVVHFGLDANGNLLAVTNALGHVTRYDLDALGRATNTWDQIGSQIRSNVAEFDDAGRLAAVVNPLSQRTQYTRDALGRVTTITRPDQASEHNAYDALGNLLSYTNAKNVAVVQTTYDGQSRPIAQTNALGNGKSWTYDAAGNLISRRDAEGAETEYSFDRMNRIDRIEYPDNSVVGFAYDEAGNLISATNADTAVSFGYDAMNRVSAVTSSVFSVLSVVNYSHDKNGNRTSLTLPGNKTINYTYDDANRPSSINLSTFGVSTFDFTYDDANRLTGITYPNGVTAAYTYDEGGRLTGLTYTKSGTAFIDRAYTYNALGQITKRTISAGLEAVPPDTHQHLRHNAADQLTHVSRMDNYENPERWRDVGPGYDANGGVTNITVKYNGMTLDNAFTWDYEGRLTAYSGEHQTNLWFVAPPIPESLSFKYDALGGRISRTAGPGGAKIHVLDQAAELKNVLVQRASNGTIERYYIYAPGFGLVAHIDADGMARYYHGDHLGSTIALTDAAGNVTDEFNYTPYGELMARTGSTDTPFTFCGRHGVYWEGGSLYHMKARYYRADLARFISPDPLGIAGGVNLYAYANGDPIRFLDALGLCATRYDTRTDVIQQTGQLLQEQHGPVFNYFAGFALDVLQRGVDTAFEAEQSGFSPETSMTLGAIQGVGESTFAGATVQLGGMGAGQALGSIPALIPAAGGSAARGLQNDPNVRLFHQGTLRGGQVSGNQYLSTSPSSDLLHYRPQGQLYEFQVPQRTLNQWLGEGSALRLNDLHAPSGIVTPEIRILPPASGFMNQFLSTGAP